METSHTTSTRGARRRPRAATVGALILLAAVTAAAHAVIPDAQRLEGEVQAKIRQQEPDALEAAFPREAYRPGSTAILRMWTAAHGVSLQVFHVGPERTRTLGSNDMQGVPMTPARRLGTVRNGSTIRVDVGDWRSGLYFAKVTAAGKVGYAPFFVRPRRLGENRVAVVLPTRTWQAYNFRSGDTWYADSSDNTVVLGRPHLNRGVPFRFRAYDLYFLNWLYRTGKRVDILSQSELELRRDPGALRRAYDLIVFPGHHEYVTEAEYDAIESFRDRGGNLVFLSANNFFWRVDIRGNVMTRVRQWRDLGRPEAALIGVQYIANDDGRSRGPWLVESSHRRSWLFSGVKLGDGVRFSNGGIEIDKTCSASPQGTQVVAQIPNLLGQGLTGQMTYYRTRRGAQVFASGAFTLAGAVRQPSVARLLENVWERYTHTHEPEERRTLAAAAPADSAALQAATRQPSYGWPVRPFHQQHPVRGCFGDPRIGMTAQGMTHTFHFGIDISAPNGTPVFATANGVVVRWPHRPETVAIRTDDGRMELQYWHIAPTVAGGTRVRAYRTVLGRIEAPWAHVHFSELRDGVYVNPLRPGALGPYADATRPTVKSLRVERAGAAVSPRAVSGSVDLVSEVIDETPIAVPAPWQEKPVTPAVISWRLVDTRGAARTSWQTAVDVRLHIPDDHLFSTVFAAWTRQNKASVRGRYRFFLAHSWDTRAVPDGRYDVEVCAGDSRGNTARRRFPLVVANEV